MSKSDCKEGGSRRPLLEIAVVALALTAGLALRLVGLNGGLPLIFHPDENRQVLDALGMAQRLSLIPAEFSYPALHKYALAAANGAYYLVGRVFGWFSGASDFAAAFLAGESSVFFVSRLVSVVAGVALGYAAYRACKQAFSRRAGLIALVYVLGMYHLIQHSQWAIADTLVALFITLSFHYAMAASRRDGALVPALLFAGLAVATKPQGLFLAAPLAVAVVFRLNDGRAEGRGLAVPKGLGLGVILFVAVAALGNLAWLFEFEASYAKFKVLSAVASVGISSAEPFTPGFFRLTGWLAKELVRQEYALGAVIVAGAIFAVGRRTREDLLFLSYMAIFLFALRDWAVRYLHLFVGLMPILVMFGARFTDALLTRLRAGTALAALLVVAVVLPSIADSVEVSLSRSKKDTRVLAKEWIEGQIPPGTAVAMDWYEFSVPLGSGAPQSLSNPRAMEYFEARVPEAVRQAYESKVADRPLYRIVPIVYSTPEPSWPGEMGIEAVAEASGSEACRELYSVFNFRTLDELKASGARYAVITSYGYTNFLLDDDPRKSADAVFNYLAKEDLLSFNRQSAAYEDDGSFGLLYFLGKRARDFYLPLLDSSAGAPLVKEFGPSRVNPGPYIKIYRIS